MRSCKGKYIKKFHIFSNISNLKSFLYKPMRNNHHSKIIEFATPSREENFIMQYLLLFLKIQFLSRSDRFAWIWVEVGIESTEQGAKMSMMLFFLLSNITSHMNIHIHKIIREQQCSNNNNKTLGNCRVSE